MMTIGKRNFMDSSKAKRRARRYPGGMAAGHGTGKMKKRIFAEIAGSRAKIFNRLATRGRLWRTLV
jgi:hypothetical protein